MKKIEIDAAPVRAGSGYPRPFDTPCRERLRHRLGDAANLTQFGVNLTRLPAGCWSSQRHWHTAEDEFVYVVEGELVLVTSAGEELLSAGDCAGFRAGTADGHHLQNRSNRDAVVLEIGTRSPAAAADAVEYPDIDLRHTGGGFQHRDGRAYASALPPPTGKPQR